MRRFFIDPSQFSGDSGTLTGPDVRHIRKVLRLKTGEKIVLFDGEGREWEARIEAVFPQRVEVTVLRERSVTEDSSVRIVLAQAFLKEKKMDLLARQLSELGIARWIPFMAERSVPDPDEKRLTLRTERWRKISRETLKQCRGSRAMEIGETVSFRKMLEIEECDLRIVFWEDAVDPIPFLPEKTGGRSFSILAALGPEGGFTPDEIAAAREKGFLIASLGRRILRAETAAVAAGAILRYLLAR